MRLIGEARRAIRSNEYDEVWCVFDHDGREECDAACLDCNKPPRVQHAVSNPCVELWFLLHFEYVAAELSAADALRRLTRHVPDYNKSSPPVDELLGCRQSVAISHAQRLRGWHVAASRSESSNPSTTMDALIEALVRLHRE